MQMVWVWAAPWTLLMSKGCAERELALPLTTCSTWECTIPHPHWDSAAELALVVVWGLISCLQVSKGVKAGASANPASCWLRVALGKLAWEVLESLPDDTLRAQGSCWTDQLSYHPGLDPELWVGPHQRLCHL